VTICEEILEPRYLKFCAELNKGHNTLHVWWHLCIKFEFAVQSKNNKIVSVEHNFNSQTYA
jgi:hypothetical protein